MIANMIKILQAELLDELDIINKDYDLDDITPLILGTQNVAKEWIKKNLPIKENNILKDSKSIYLVFKWICKSKRIIIYFFK